MREMRQCYAGVRMRGVPSRIIPTRASHHVIGHGGSLLARRQVARRLPAEDEKSAGKALPRRSQLLLA